MNGIADLQTCRSSQNQVRIFVGIGLQTCRLAGHPKINLGSLQEQDCRFADQQIIPKKSQDPCRNRTADLQTCRSSQNIVRILVGIGLQICSPADHPKIKLDSLQEQDCRPADLQIMKTKVRIFVGIGLQTCRPADHHKIKLGSLQEQNCRPADLQIIPK